MPLKQHPVLIASVGHLALLVAIQIEDFLLYVLQPAHAPGAIALFAGLLPFRQLEPLVAVALLVALGLACWRRGPGRALFVLVVTAANLYVVFDQSCYPMFFDHFNLSMMDAAPVALFTLLDSIQAELDWVFPLNLALALGMTVASTWQAVRWRASRMAPPDGPPAPRRAWPPRTLAVAAALYVVVALGVQGWGPPAYNLDRHPLVELVASAVPRAVPTGEVALTPGLFALKYGTPTASPTDRAPLDRAFAELRTIAAPNLVFVVLEGVGTKELLPDGQFRPRFTPTLAAMAPHMVIFDALYGTYPGTIRTHLPLITGGRTTTWTPVDDDVLASYRGPMLPTSLARAGYRTALYSAGDFRAEQMGQLYARLGFESLFLGGDEAGTLPSWGMDEAVVMDMAIRWIDRVSADGRAPFYLQFLTGATHHPYDVLESAERPLEELNRESRFINALHYTDHVLATLLAVLEQRGLAANTVVAVMGDHGQAFGTLHAGNLGHINHLYEENGRTELLVWSPRLTGGPFRTSRVGSVGDVMPTLLAVAGTSAEGPLGQNLFSPRYTERVVYFHKNLNPAQWGLRDGHWKFISSQTRTAAAELYDLATDPDEQHNLASGHHDMVEAYQDACRTWYMATNRDYLMRAGLTASPSPRPR